MHISVINIDKKGLGSDDKKVEEITSGTAKFTLTSEGDATFEGVSFGDGNVKGKAGQKSIDIEGNSIKITGLKRSRNTVFIR